MFGGLKLPGSPIKNCDYMYTKKRGSLYLLLVPQTKAFALPNLSRTSNAEAHADMIIYTVAVSTNRYYHRLI